jgi:hypothetical protein
MAVTRSVGTRGIAGVVVKETCVCLNNTAHCPLVSAPYGLKN